MSSRLSGQRSSKGSGSLVKARAVRVSSGQDAKPKSTTTFSRVSVVNTNLNAHDKQDPFHAFTVLSRLLISLVTRSGGCSYKFTPDEHRLSLHLLSIIEPFIISPTSGANYLQGKTQLAHQPTEILDAIVSHIETRDDLLALAATCHRMRMVVVPRHSEYRTIRCKISAVSVWNHLIVHKALARNVRRLEILDERWTPSQSSSRSFGVLSNSTSTSISNALTPGDHKVELLPPNIDTTDTDLESTDDELHLHSKHERYFVAALSKMTGLTSFFWGCNHSPMSIDSPPIWDVLVKRGLIQVEVCDNTIFGPLPDGNPSDEDSGDSSSGEESEDVGRPLASRPVHPQLQLILPAVRTLTFISTKQQYGATKNPDLGRIRGILNYCPNLQSLKIFYQPHRTTGTATATVGGGPLLMDPLLLFHRFPLLTHLSISNMRCSPFGGVDALGPFLSAHRCLEVLELNIGSIGRGAVITSTTGTQTTSPGAFMVRHSRLVLEAGSLSRLREIRASNEIIVVVLACPVRETGQDSDVAKITDSLHEEDSDAEEEKEALTSTKMEDRQLLHHELGNYSRPLTTIKGIRLHSSYGCHASANPNLPILAALRLPMVGDRIRRLELAGYDDVEDVKRLVECVRNVVWLDIGRKRGVSPGSARGSSQSVANGSVGNANEWINVLIGLPNLTTFHGVKFFYELSPAAEATVYASGAGTSLNAPPNATLSLADRSRLKKNEEVASMLVWKCPKLRRLDHWEEGAGKVIILIKDGLTIPSGEKGKGKEREGGREKVRWEVRRVKV